MAQEIERKFLAHPGYKAEASRCERICQGYLSSVPERTVRVRVERKDRVPVLETQGVVAWEHEIPVPDALELLQLCEPGRIDKTRHYIPCGAHLWEVDEFHGDNEGLVLAEIELRSPDEPFARPSWLGEEVTGDPRYYNAALAACPFRCWHSRP